MKLITRTLIILAAGALVTGALLAFGRTEMATQMREEGPRGGHFEGRERPPFGMEGQRPGEGFEGQASDGRFEGRFEGRGGERHGGASLSGFAEVIGNLVKVGIIIALFAIGARLLQLRRKDQPARQG